MTRYRFHVLNDTSYVVDEEGYELPDLDAVRLHARQAIGAIMADEIGQGRSAIHLSILVDDDSGERVANFRANTTIVTSQGPFAQ